MKTLKYISNNEVLWQSRFSQKNVFVKSYLKNEGY